MPRVVWGFLETAERDSPTKRFSRVDLPTFGLPRIEIKPERGGRVNSSGLLQFLEDSVVEVVGQVKVGHQFVTLAGPDPKPDCPVRHLTDLDFDF